MESKEASNAEVSQLKADDVKRLLTDPSVETRAETAAKVAGEFGMGSLSAGERE